MANHTRSRRYLDSATKGLLTALISLSASCTSDGKTDEAATSSTAPPTETSETTGNSQPASLTPETTTSSPEIDRVGLAVIERWWFPAEGLTYQDLADGLESENLITKRLAETWRTQADQPVEPVGPDIRIIETSTVRIEDTNATFEVIYESRENPGEPSKTFLEFSLIDNSWLADKVV